MKYNKNIFIAELIERWIKIIFIICALFCMLHITHVITKEEDKEKIMLEKDLLREQISSFEFERKNNYRYDY